MKPGINAHCPHLPTAHLRQQLLQRRRDDGVVEGLHAFAADLEVEAGQAAAVSRHDLGGNLFPKYLVQGPVDDVFWATENLAILVHTQDYLAPFRVANGHGAGAFPAIARQAAAGNPTDAFNLLAQVIPIRALLAVDESDLVVATLGGDDHHALEREVEPAFGLGDEGGGGNSFLFGRHCNRLTIGAVGGALPNNPAIAVEDLDLRGIIAVFALLHAPSRRVSSEPLLLPLLPPV